MGQGALTAFAQIAADSLGLDVDQVTLRFGSTDLPDGGVAGGSGHTATAGSAIDAASRNAVARLAELATADRNSPLFGAGNVGVIARAGRLCRRDDESRSESYAEILARAGLAEIDGWGKGARDPAAVGDHALQAHGAVFAEVKVDPDLGQVRATRLVGAFAAGRIINPRLVRSQLYGGMIWGVSFALLEGASVDRRSGRIMNADLGEYHVPVNADAPSLEALLVHEDDPYVNALGVKGVGEIGITGTVGAIANAVWHATGTRVRKFPVRIEDIVAHRRRPLAVVRRPGWGERRRATLRACPLASSARRRHRASRHHPDEVGAIVGVGVKVGIEAARGDGDAVERGGREIRVQRRFERARRGTRRSRPRRSPRRERRPPSWRRRRRPAHSARPGSRISCKPLSAGSGS